MKNKNIDNRLLGPDLFSTMTLNEAVKAHALTASCKKCGRWVEVDMRKLAEKYGGDHVVSKIANRLRCKCGSREKIFTFVGRSYFESHIRRGLRPGPK